MVLEQWKLEGLYDVLETQDRALLTELDEAIDEYKRLEWLDRATKVLNTALGHAVNEEPTTTLEALPDAPYRRIRIGGPVQFGGGAGGQAQSVQAQSVQEDRCGGTDRSRSSRSSKRSRRRWPS